MTRTQNRYLFIVRCRQTNGNLSQLLFHLYGLVDSIANKRQQDAYFPSDERGINSTDDKQQRFVTPPLSLPEGKTAHEALPF